MVQNLINCTRYNIISAHQCLFRSIIIHFYSKHADGNPDTNNCKQTIEKQNTIIPEPPTTCCMSGCANCVWIEYAEKLSKLFNDGGEKAMESVLKSVDDSNMRAFLSMELRNLRK